MSEALSVRKSIEMLLKIKLRKMVSIRVIVSVLKKACNKDMNILYCEGKKISLNLGKIAK